MKLTQRIKQKIITQALMDVKKGSEDNEENLITITIFIFNNIFTQANQQQARKKEKIFIYVIEPYFC